MLRTGPEKHDGTHEAEVLLVRRAKAPEIGKWTVPGGSLELGEDARGKLLGSHSSAFHHLDYHNLPDGHATQDCSDR